jgi:hypothetical protein
VENGASFDPSVVDGPDRVTPGRLRGAEFVAPVLLASLRAGYTVSAWLLYSMRSMHVSIPQEISRE